MAQRLLAAEREIDTRESRRWLVESYTYRGEQTVVYGVLARVTCPWTAAGRSSRPRAGCWRRRVWKERARVTSAGFDFADVRAPTQCESAVHCDGGGASGLPAVRATCPCLPPSHSWLSAAPDSIHPRAHSPRRAYFRTPPRFCRCQIPEINKNVARLKKPFIKFLLWENQGTKKPCTPKFYRFMHRFF